MRYLTALLITTMLSICSMSVSGQNLAHVNRGQILQNMPEVQQAQKNLQTYSKELESQVQSLLKEYRSKLQSFEQNSGNMSETQRNDKQRELKNLEERIQKFRQDAQKQVSQKRSELLEPIMQNVNDAIQQVAKEKGYTYVFDASQGSILYAEESRNITPMVRQRLDL